ncbi:spore germination protein [Bacillus sp. z60-18]|uniref:spore germination protein n=1 Tax=Bacillus TaxID=1386 RepID=UPI00098A9407|nr:MULTISPECIES: spore germination protein [Bacillus]WFA06433.1 spore germination protein [Bacillus sp. HSf4]
MKHSCSVYIHHVSAGGIVNFGGAYRISPVTMEKVIEGAGGPDVGTAVAESLSPIIGEGTINVDD